MQQNGLRNLFKSKKAVMALIADVVIGGMAYAGLITHDTAAQLIALVTGGYVFAQGVSEFGTGGTANKG